MLGIFAADKSVGYVIYIKIFLGRVTLPSSQQQKISVVRYLLEIPGLHISDGWTSHHFVQSAGSELNVQARVLVPARPSKLVVMATPACRSSAACAVARIAVRTPWNAAEETVANPELSVTQSRGNVQTGQSSPTRMPLRTP